MTALEYGKYKLSRYIPGLSSELIKPLKPYQIRGILFLIKKLPERCRGIILGDEVGLGKTLQCVLTCESLKAKRILIICPATLKINWSREIIKWLGPQSVHIIKNGKPPDPTKRWNIINYDILETHYDSLIELQYDILLCDESHYIKNNKIQRSKYIVGGLAPAPKVDGKRPVSKETKKPLKRRIEGLASYASNRVIMMTGTPLTNKTMDLYNLLRAVGHPLGTNQQRFGLQFCAPQKVTSTFIGKDGKERTATHGTLYEGASNTQKLRKLIDPIFLQRKKKDVLKELSPIQREWIAVEVDTRAYKSVMDDYDRRREAGELSNKITHLAVLNEARAAVAIAKVGWTIEMAESLIEQGEKVLIGSQFTRVTNLLEKHFKDRAVYYTGELSAKQKQEAVDLFQSGAKELFIGTYTNGQSAATGLTLTQASSVIVQDLDWVPANLVQFIGRADRIGQTRSVSVYLPIANDTFDVDMAEMLEKKLQNVNDFEGQKGSLFEDLVERLQKAPRNLEAKALLQKRKAQI